jgi:hypothetical protein
MECDVGGKRIGSRDAFNSSWLITLNLMNKQTSLWGAGEREVIYSFEILEIGPTVISRIEQASCLLVLKLFGPERN